MALQIFLLFVGAVLVLWGADRLTDGAVAIAKRMAIPEIIIGLTIVSVATSMPELFISVVAALKDNPDITAGNVVGSNIFNTMMIVGLAAFISPITILKSTVNKDVPFAVIASALFFSFWLFGGDITRLKGVVLLAGLVFFMYYTLQQAKNGMEEDQNVQSGKGMIGASVFYIVIGLVCLVVGSNLFVDGATALAKGLGVSDAVIGLTIVAAGTSLPELATSVVAAYKGQSGIAIGNVLGSNVFNILFVLGLTGVLSPLRITGLTPVDLGVMILSMIVLWLFSRTKYIVSRTEGFLLVILYVAYVGWLIWNLSHQVF
ncbi:MAG: calcium/sodium antiporter [Paludibacteraceae bacterium]|nr:calcium/sodium antiporter [Paludibacteraceae bacterium]